MAYKHWSAKDEQFLIDNYNLLTINQIAKELGRTYSSIKNKAQSFELTKEKKDFKKWSNEELKLLEDNYGKLTICEISEKIERSERAVLRKINELNLNKDNKKTYEMWTKEEEEFLNNNIGSKTISYLAEKLNRTEKAILSKCNKEGLGSWTEGFLKSQDVCRILNISRQKLTRLRNKGLKFKVENGRLYITLEKLVKFLKDNQDLWDSRKLEKYALGKEYDWLLEKRKKDLTVNVNNGKKWTAYEEMRLIELYKKGILAKEIALELNRTTVSISKKLADLSRKKKVFLNRALKWTEKEEIELMKLYNSGTPVKEICNILSRCQPEITERIKKLSNNKAAM